MAGYKETPRQKMIGMMYLVLTALLALNVSKEILDAFVIVNESIETTSVNFAGKVGSLHNDFTEQYNLDATKVGPYYAKAKQAEVYSDDLIQYIDSVKYAVIAATEGIPLDSAKVISLKNIAGKDNYDVPTRLLVGEEGFKRRGGYLLQDKIDEYRLNMMAIVPEKDRPHFKMGLITDGEYRDAGNMKQDWVEHNFYHTILAADVTIFNKLKNEVLNTEYDVVNYLFQGITKEDFKFSSIEAKVLPQSMLVFQGEPYTAEIIVAAIDETSKPIVEYKLGATEWDDDFLTGNNAVQLKGDSGIVNLSINTSNKEPRKYTFAGRIGIKKPNGIDIEYHYFASSFFVAEPSANVSATKMNVFYRGVDNPVKISASGVPETQLEWSLVGDGQIKKTKEGLVVTNLKKKTVQSVMINVFNNNGTERKKLGEQEFRVKDLPDPVVFVTGATKGNVPRQAFLANPYIRCALPEYVNFEYKYKVVGFNMWVKKNGSDYQMVANSGKLSSDMLSYIRSARKGTLLVFTDINVRGPIRKRDVGSFVIKVN